MVEASPTAIAGQTGNVVGTTYTSPTFGTASPGMRRSRCCPTSRQMASTTCGFPTKLSPADLFAAAGDKTPAQCIDNLVAFYENDPLYSDITFVTDAQSQPIRTTGDSQATG